MNPVVVFGPCMTKAHTKASPSFLRDFLYSNSKPNAWISIVDVREVADAHVAALQKSETAGKRYIIARDDSAAYLNTLAAQTAKANPEYLIKPYRTTSVCLLSLYLNLTLSVFILGAAGVAAVVGATGGSVVPSAIAGGVALLVLVGFSLFICDFQ
jgi:hypothetical protein